jgi:ABC-type antimicrobial peptide transport system permease subunit
MYASSDKTLFEVINEDEYIKYLEEYDASFLNTLESQIYLEQNFDNNSRIMYEIIFIVLTMVTIIIVYTTMRSKMISDIYRIGVYRSLGARKNRIYNKYLIELLLLTFMTVMLGFLISTGLYYLVCTNISIFVEEVFLFFNVEYFILACLFIVLTMLIFGMLPIVLLLKKTPSEICAKYDI